MTARDPNDPGGFPEESFVGRTAELAWLRAAMARAATGHPAVVVVAGLPGIGKTALLRTFAAATCREFEGARVAAAGGEQSESQTAFAFVGQLARALGDTAPVAEKAEPMAVGARLLEAIGSASEAGPLLLVVDDLQWIDPASIDALVFALRRLGIDQVLAVLAVRSGGDEPTHSAIARLAGRPGSDLVTLTGLTAEEVGQLASALGAAALSHRGAGALAQHTGGVPLYVRALLEDVDIDELNAGGPFGLPAPRSFAAVISDRLGACSDSTRRLVEAGAVLGPGSSLALLAELAGVRPALADVDEAAAAKLLHEPRPGDPRVEFRHPLIQAAVYQIIPPARRAELHERAATLVGQSGDQWEALRHRAAASPGRDESLAAALADHAGQRLADGAIDAALAALLTAYRVARRGPSADGYLLRAADVMLASGDLARAAATVERARAAPDRCRRRFVEGSLAFFAGRRAEAERLLLEAWNGCGPDDGDVAGRVAARLGALALNEGRGEDTLRWTEQALALARPEDAARASAAAMRLMALGVMGREDTAEAVTASLPPVVRHPNLVESDMLLGRGVLRLWQGDALGAAGDLTAAVDAARGQGPLHALLMGLCYLAEAEFRTGRWDEAVTHAELAVSLGDDAGVPWTAALAHASAVAPMAARGQWKLAEAHVASAAGAADELGGTAALLWAGVARARLVHSSGRPAAVVAGKPDPSWLAYPRFPKNPFRWHLFHQRGRQLKTPSVVTRDRDGINRLMLFGFQKGCRLQTDIGIIPDN